LDKRVPCSSTAGDERSLAIKITSKIDENAKDKIMISPISHQDSQHLSVTDADNTRFFSFDFMLDPAYEVPHNWALHFQAWQCCAGHPPFVIAVSDRPDKLAPVEFSFEVRNDATELEKFGQAFSIYKVVISRGIWHTIVLELQPRAIGSPTPGKIGIWLDGEKKREWLGYWGFAPNPSSPSIRGPVKDNIGLDLGVYRRRQMTAQTILFDNISFASTISGIARHERCATKDKR
jgi:hypothetical protein